MDIKAFFQKHCGVHDAALLSELVERTRVRILDQCTTVIEPGSEVKSMFLLLSGIVRGYFWGDGDRTYTDGFYENPGTLLSVGSATAQEQEYGIETITTCKILELPAADMAILMESSLPFMQMYCRLLQKMVCMQWREKTVYCQYSPQQRYQRFLKRFPNWKGQIGSRYIADYVGIAPESLSRLRHRLREQKQCP